jgi:hypothetical protein
VEVFKFGSDCGIGECFEWRSVAPLLLCRVEDIIAMAERIRPQLSRYCHAPSVFGVYKGRPCSILELSNATFSNSRLKMGVDPAEGDGLLLLHHVSHEDVFSKAAIVGVIMLNFDAHSASISLEGVLSHQGFGCVV